MSRSSSLHGTSRDSSELGGSTGGRSSIDPSTAKMHPLLMKFTIYDIEPYLPFICTFMLKNVYYHRGSKFLKMIGQKYVSNVFHTGTQQLFLVYGERLWVFKNHTA